jgi:anti-sigma B factor antagonist
VAGGPAASRAGAAVHGGNEAGCTAQRPPGTHVIPGPRREDAAPRPKLSIYHRDDVVVVSLRGELDLLGASVLQAHLSDIRCQGWPRSVADLAGLAFIDCACLGVLVRHCKEIRGRGGSFALAGPRPAVRRILSVTGLLSWFEVHATVEDAVTGTGTQR